MAKDNKNKATATKWNSGYYSSGYKSAYSTSYSNSSFWMDEDFLDNKDTDILGKGTKPAVDYVKLAGYKRAIANFVKIVTNKDNIPVKFSSGDQSYTDGDIVVISSKLEEKEFDSTVGLALHEGSHIALTNFKAVKEYMRSSGPYLMSLLNWHNEKWPKQTMDTWELMPMVKDLANIIEDRRIDKFIYDNAPGYQGYYKALYDKYFNAKEIDLALISGAKCERTFNDYLFHICNFVNPNRQLNALPALQEIWDIINIKNISRLTSTEDVFKIVTNVLQVIAKDIDGLGEKSKGGDDQEPGPGNEGTGEGEPNGADVNDTDDETNDEMGGMGADMNLDMQGSNSSDSDTDGPDSSSGGDIDPKEAAKQAKEAKALEDAIQKQKDFLNGNIKKKKLSATDAKKINAASESNMNYASVGGDVENVTGNTMKGQKTSCMVIKGITTTLIESALVSSHLTDPVAARDAITKARYGRTDYIAEGIALGTLLGKRLKTRDEERSLKTSRLDTGRIDRRLVAELGFGNDKVFSQVLHTTVTPSIIHISIDASGSMHGKKWEASIKTAVAIAKAATMINSLDVVISIRGCYNSGSPLMFIAYDSRKDKFSVIKDKFYALKTDGSTPEGLCLQAVLDEIIKSSQGKDSYFINLCDGEPGYSDANIQYGGDYAVEHTRTQVNKMRKAGIKILAYFVTDESVNKRSMDKFRKMYGPESTHIDLNNLTQLAASINKLFVRNV